MFKVSMMRATCSKKRLFSLFIYKSLFLLFKNTFFKENFTNP